METVQTYYKNIKECTTKDGIASDLVVAVMTVCGSLGSPINLLEIFDHYMETGADFYSYELSYVPNSKKTKDNKNKAFYNCLNVTFYYSDKDNIESKISAKVFPNGSIQIPGCKTIDTVQNVPIVLFNFINRIAEKCKDRIIIQNPELFKLQNVRIVMINSNFSFKQGILLERLKTIINNNRFEGTINSENIWRIASFQPEKYSGCNIRYMTNKCRMDSSDLYTDPNKKIPLKLDGQVSIFIFRSGKGTITGAKTSSDIQEAYHAIINLVRDNKDILFQY